MTNRVTGAGLQVWLPALRASPYRAEVQRDIQRAYLEWRGEGRVFLIPGFPEPRRWQEGPGGIDRVLAVPSEHLNRVDVYHVGVNGYVWGRGAAVRFPQGRVDGLLEVWLNVVSGHGVKVAPAPDAVTLEVPIPVGKEGVSYETVGVSPEPAPTLPIVESDDTSRKTLSVWPPSGRGLPRPSVSPEAESAGDRLGVRTRSAGPTSEGLQLVQMGVVSWPAPLEVLFPTGSGLDDLYAQAQMTDLVRQSREDAEGARHAAREKAAPYVSPGWTTRELSWLGPTYFGGKNVGKGDQAVVIDAMRFGIDVENLEEFFQSSKWKRLRAEQVPATRVWGAVGLFWALMAEALETRRAFVSCQRCGRIFEGRRHKRFCGPTDDTGCFRERRAHAKRQSRSRDR